MRKEETAKIIGAMMVYYPNYAPIDNEMTITLWTDAFADYPYEAVAKALKTYAMSDKSGFAPSIGALNNIIQTVTEEVTNAYMNEMEAWNLVSKALRDGTYHAQERFDELPPLIQRAVGSPNNLHNWAQTDYETIDTVVMSQFQRTYRAEVSRAKETARYPLEIRTAIENHTPIMGITATPVNTKLLEKGDYE